jgi:hypothetical protein
VSYKDSSGLKEDMRIYEVTKLGVLWNNGPTVMKFDMSVMTWRPYQTRTQKVQTSGQYFCLAFLGSNVSQETSGCPQ